MRFSKALELIGAPLDFGANILGAHLGPTEIRNAQVHEKITELSYTVEDSGDIPIPSRDTVPPDDVELKYLHTIERACISLSEKVYGALQSQRIPITLGGDHSIAIGSLSGTSKYCKENQKSLGLLWFDAHADMNTPETSPSGNIHGMPLATLLGRGYENLVNIAYKGQKIENLRTALVGVRSIDDLEKKLCKDLGIHIYTMRDIDERGMKNVMADISKNVIEKADAIHVSFDLDCIDPFYAPGVSTPELGGLNYRESHLALEWVADSEKLISADFVEYNPTNDHKHKTAKLTVELLQSLLGKNIL